MHLLSDMQPLTHPGVLNTNTLAQPPVSNFVESGLAQHQLHTTNVNQNQNTPYLLNQSLSVPTGINQNLNPPWDQFSETSWVHLQSIVSSSSQANTNENTDGFELVSNRANSGPANATRSQSSKTPDSRPSDLPRAVTAPLRLSSTLPSWLSH